jgi:hypothetical protein
MHFGIATINLQGNEIRITNHRHTDNFSLDKLGNKELADAIRKDLKEIYQDLNGVYQIEADLYNKSIAPNTANDYQAELKLYNGFKSLVPLNSSPPLTDVIYRMIEIMKERKTIAISAVQLIPDTYRFSDPELTKAAFEHHSTNEFYESIKRDLTDKLKKHKDNVNKVERNLITKDDTFFEERPKLNNMSNGLMLAVNDTWGFRVTLDNYTYIHASKRYTPKMKITLFDHFGLDYNDINNFGLAEKIREHFQEKNDMSQLIPKIKDFAGNKFGYEFMAKGFRAWFILQHFYGYRPFVTVMERTINLDGGLK